MEKAIFAAGCFWGVEAAFRKVREVTGTRVGYSGGTLADPSYEAVCTGNTGHAEVVEVVFDPAQLSYAELLEVFWSVHDPTTLNRQGPDVGTQYRSALLTRDEEQAEVARTSKEAQQRAGRFPGPIVTEIAPAKEFFPAEEYHQQYFEKQAGKVFRAF